DQLGLQPGGKLGADRLHQHDPLARDEEDRDVIIHPGVVDVARQFADRLAFVFGLLIEGSLLSRQNKAARAQRYQKLSFDRFCRRRRPATPYAIPGITFCGGVDEIRRGAYSSRTRYIGWGTAKPTGTARRRGRRENASPGSHAGSRGRPWDAPRKPYTGS